MVLRTICFAITVILSVSVAVSAQLEQVIFETDNNGNYVRDDIEEYIFEIDPKDPQLIKFLLAYVRIDQESIQNYLDKEIVSTSSHTLFIMRKCLKSARPDYDSSIMDELFARLRSTENISRAYIK